MRNSNQPAIPCDEYDLQAGHWEGRYEVQKQFRGLTKRELFAAMAMQGLLACPEEGLDADYMARNAVTCADAMLAELERTEPL